MAVGLGITFYYLVADIPPISDRPLIADISTLPISASITMFAIEAIGVVSCNNYLVFVIKALFVLQVMPLENHMASPQSFTGLCGVLNQGMSFVTLIYVLLGFFGYLRYGDATEGSITYNLPKDAM